MYSRCWLCVTVTGTSSWPGKELEYQCHCAEVAGFCLEQRDRLHTDVLIEITYLGVFWFVFFFEVVVC